MSQNSETCPVASSLWVHLLLDSDSLKFALWHLVNKNSTSGKDQCFDEITLGDDLKRIDQIVEILGFKR